MKKFRSLNTYFKLITLIISTSILFFLLYVALYAYTIKQEKYVYKTTQKQYITEVSSIIQLNSKSLISTITDVTFWDDLYFFAQNKDTSWYDEYLASQFETYEVDYFAVYNINNEFVAKTSNAKIKTAMFISNEVMQNLKQTKLTRFYMRIPEGVAEVVGSTIHTSNDPKKNKVKPSGYFFMVRLLDKNFCKNLSATSNSEVSVVLANQENNVAKDVLQAVVKLNDVNNVQTASLVFKRVFNLHYNNTKEILIILILASLINVVVYFYFSRRWIYKPLNIITDVLETENPIAIEDLKKEPGEFGYIGNLFEAYSKQRKQLELSKEKAEESDKLKSSFLANLSHEIRTPMNAIVGFSDLLSDPNLVEENKIEYLKIIKNCGANLVSIIEDLVEMSKIDSNQIVPNYKGINLKNFISEMYKTIHVTIPKDKEIEFLFFDNLIHDQINIVTDEIKLKQVLVNLISNAVKFTETGKVVFSCHIQEDKKNILFTVKDTGFGIDETNLKVIFDRFRRVENEYSAELSGLGLGLSISKAYVEILGGGITVESELNVGSIFSFTIPLVYDNSVSSPDANQVTALFEKSENKTILVAEDDNINFLLLQKILGLRNYEVIRARNGQEAVTICRENSQINLVFMDLKMPILNGFDAYKVIHLEQPNLPIVAQTAYASPEDFDNIKRAGFKNYITKPLDKQKIFELIDSLFMDA